MLRLGPWAPREGAPNSLGTRNQIQMRKGRVMLLVKGRLWSRNTFLIDNIELYMIFLF